MAYTKLDRVRPSPAGVWDSTRSYTALELVNSPDGWKAYLARKAVPAGTALTDTVYWTEVLDVSDVIAAAEAATADANAAAAFAEPIRTKADGIKCTLEGTSVSASDASDDYLRGLRVFGKTTQNGTPSPNTPIPLVSVGSGGSVGVQVSGKNLLSKPNISTFTSNGITFAVKNDGSITCNGTATAVAIFQFNEGVKVNKGSYILNGCPSGGSNSTYSLRLAEPDSKSYDDYGNGIVYETSSDVTLRYLSVIIRSGVTVNNLIFKPMFRHASVIDATYEPYKTAQSITLSTPNGLPGLPVTSGGNYTDANGQQWISDEIDLERGVYVQRVGARIYTSASDFAKAPGDGNYADRFLASVNEIMLPYVGLSSMHSIDAWGTGDNTIGLGTRTSSTLYARFNGVTTLEQLNVLLASTPLVVAYGKATPVETALSAAEIAAYRAIHTNYPNTTVYNDASAHMAVSYNADTKTYIDNKFAALSAAIV